MRLDDVFLSQENNIVFLSFFSNMLNNNKIRHSTERERVGEILYLPIFEMEKGKYLFLIPLEYLLYVMDNFLSDFGYYRALTVLLEEEDRKFSVAIYRNGIDSLFVNFIQLRSISLKLSKHGKIEEEIELEKDYTIFYMSYVYDYGYQRVNLPNRFLVRFGDEEEELIIEVKDKRHFAEYVVNYLYWQEELEKLKRIKNLPYIF